MSKHIFWISSYPKSGNTLVRALLTSLFFSPDGNFNFDIIKNISQFEMSERLNFIESINQNDFKQIDNLLVLSKYWERAQNKENLNVKGSFLFLKSHSCNASINNNNFTTEKNTVGFIYIVRDPRDVVISWSKFSNISIDESINFISDYNSCIRWANKGKHSKVPKNTFPKAFVSSWDNHVESWTNNSLKTPKIIIKYEDLIYKKEEVIHEIKNFKNLVWNVSAAIGHGIFQSTSGKDFDVSSISMECLRFRFPQKSLEACLGKLC